MVKYCDVVITVNLKDWNDFVSSHAYNPFVKCADIKHYGNTEIINVLWNFVKWYTKDDYIDEILNYFEEHSYILTTVDDDNYVNQVDGIKYDDDTESCYWDYVHKVKLIV